MSAGTVAGTAVVTIAAEASDFSGAGDYSLANLDDADTIYLDYTSPVTSSTGFPLGPGIATDFRLNPGQNMYGACATGGTALYRLIRREV